MIKWHTVNGLICGRVNNKHIGTLQSKEDGYYDWYPAPLDTTRYLPSWFLRQVADKLDELNKDWDTQVKQDVG